MQGGMERDRVSGSRIAQLWEEGWGSRSHEIGWERWVGPIEKSQ